MTLDEGLLFASDSRTNAGVDHVSTFSKMSIFETPGERAIVLMNSGNLATTQSVVGALRQALTGDQPHLLNVPTLFDAAALVGEAVRQTIHHHGASQQSQSSGIDFSCNFLVGGQIAGEAPRLFLVYPVGNFIESSPDTPYFQIGESKYGKPIIDRVIRPETPLDEAVKCALVSFDSTIKSNLSVGLPIDLALVPRDACRISVRHRIEPEDEYFGSLRRAWGQGLRKVFNELPDPDWLPARRP